MSAVPTPRVVSIQVGLPQVHGQPGAQDPLAQPWRTGFYKSPGAGPVWVGRTNLAGDGQANRRVHGGPDKAVLMYTASHYPHWRAELDMPELPYGASPDGDTRKVYRTAHIHVKVKGPERTTLTSQLYFPENAEGNSRDGFAIDALLLRIEETPSGKVGSFDFVLK